MQLRQQQMLVAWKLGNSIINNTGKSFHQPMSQKIEQCFHY